MVVFWHFVFPSMLQKTKSSYYLFNVIGYLKNRSKQTRETTSLQENISKLHNQCYTNQELWK